jgi:Family of unknown function (DUF5677)
MTHPSEVQLLLHDVLQIHRVCEEKAKTHVIDADTWDAGRYYAIAGDLWQKHVNHCQGVALLLGSGLFESAIVVGRAAYETAITLVYLMTVGDKKRNALIFEAHMVVDTAEVFRDEKGHVAEKAQAAIATFPDDVIAQVRSNRKARLPWSGKNIAEMAEAIKLTGHRTIYAIMSWEAHARVAGWGIEKVKDQNGDVKWTFGSAARPRDVEALANHARRMLHQVYQIVTRDFYGKTPPLATLNPFERNRIELERRRED